MLHRCGVLLALLVLLLAACSRAAPPPSESSSPIADATAPLPHTPPLTETVANAACSPHTAGGPRVTHPLGTGGMLLAQPSPRRVW